MRPIEEAVNKTGSQLRLANEIGVEPARVWNWVHRDKKVPAEYCIAIESATAGAVTRYDLRPDVFGDAPTERAA